MTNTRHHIVVAIFASALFAVTSHALPLVDIQTVTVGDAGNAADGTGGYGAVAYEFNIGKYEVTIGQYTTFLNSVAAITSESYIVDLWHPNMASNLNIAGISRGGSGVLADPYSYSEIGSGNRPIAYVNWFDAARFANWVNNGATNGASTETGAYTLNGAISGVTLKNAGATWYLPSEDEWYKAAYYKGGGTDAGYWFYTTQSDTAPSNNIGDAPNQANYRYNNLFSVTQSATYDSNQNYLTEVGAFSGSASSFGTYDQGGNLWEWNDAVDLATRRGVRGGTYGDTVPYGLQSNVRSSDLPQDSYDYLGFRLATVPEPSALSLVALSFMGLGGGYVLVRRR